MKEYAEQFYSSKAWQKCRTSFKKSKGGLCELCLKEGIVEVGVIVHHKVHITPDNIHIPEITLAHNNMQLLCRKHHAEMHGKKKRFKVDERGKVVPLFDF